MQVLRLVVTLFLVANNTVGYYKPLFIVMVQPAPQVSMYSQQACLKIQTQDGRKLLYCSARDEIVC